MDATAEQLTAETARWRARLDRERARCTPKGPRGEEFLANIDAYRRDADHFEKAGDLVRAFECVVWAWAWLEIGADAGEVRWERVDDKL